MRVSSLVVLLGLLAPLPAQRYTTSPNGFASTEAPGTSFFFGGDSFGRVMFLDGEVGRATLVVREVAYRPEAGGSSWMGRTWSRVSLHVSDCDLNATSTVFSANPTSSPTLAFTGSATWPSITGAPGGAWRIRFPFRTPWLRRGGRDVCLDYDFEGGTLHNQSLPWWKLTPYTYLLDGYDVRQTVAGKETYVPYDPSIAGTVIWGQGAWNDTGNGALLFTQGARNTVPRLPREYRHRVLFQRDNARKRGSGSWARSDHYPTVTRYGH